MFIILKLQYLLFGIFGPDWIFFLKNRTDFYFGLFVPNRVDRISEKLGLNQTELARFGLVLLSP